MSALVIITGQAEWAIDSLCFFDQIEANLGKLQPENRQNVHKTRFFFFFLKKALGVNGLNEKMTD